LCFPRSRFSYQEILYLGKLVTSDILSDVWVSHYTSSFLVWCLENHLYLLSISILIRLGYLREHVENLKLSWMKIQNEQRRLVTWDQSLTLRPQAEKKWKTFLGPRSLSADCWTQNLARESLAFFPVAKNMLNDILVKKRNLNERFYKEFFVWSVNFNTLKK